MYMCMWGYLDKYIRIATWPPKQKFLALPLVSLLLISIILILCWFQKIKIPEE